MIATRPPEPRVATPLSEFTLQLVRNRRARRYILRVDPSGQVRITIPRGGSESFARRFAAEKVEWIRAQIERVTAGQQPPRIWTPGTEVWYRGQRIPLERMDGLGRLGEQTFLVPDSDCDWRPLVEAHLRRLAEREFPPLVADLAARHRLVVHRVTVRAQRTRWGSCSRKGTISLNWRLVQAPILVRDYLIAHELAHLREMNHSRRFWRIVQEMFPEWRDAERWLKRHGRDLLG